MAESIALGFSSGIKMIPSAPSFGRHQANSRNQLPPKPSERLGCHLLLGIDELFEFQYPRKGKLTISEFWRERLAFSSFPAAKTKSRRAHLT